MTHVLLKHEKMTDSILVCGTGVVSGSASYISAHK